MGKKKSKKLPVTSFRIEVFRKSYLGDETDLGDYETVISYSDEGCVGESITIRNRLTDQEGAFDEAKKIASVADFTKKGENHGA